MMCYNTPLVLVSGSYDCIYITHPYWCVTRSHGILCWGTCVWQTIKRYIGCLKCRQSNVTEWRDETCQATHVRVRPSRSLMISNFIPWIGAVIEWLRILLRVVYLQIFILCSKDMTVIMHMPLTGLSLLRTERPGLQTDSNSWRMTKSLIRLWRCQLQIFCEQQNVWRWGGWIQSRQRFLSIRNMAILNLF